MFVLNQSVGFLLLLFYAAYAYGFTRQDIVDLLGKLLRRFHHSPRDFFLPPKAVCLRQ